MGETSRKKKSSVTGSKVGH